MVHILSPKVNHYLCYFDSYIGSFVCKKQIHSGYFIHGILQKIRETGILANLRGKPEKSRFKQE